MRSESGKLNAWRKAAALELLGNGGKTHLTCQSIFKAAALRDEHYHNEAYKDALRRGNAAMLACSLVLVISGLLYMAWRGEFGKLDDGWNHNSFEFVIRLTLIGILGANVSAITDVTQAQASARIPEMVATLRIALLRLFVGAASAILLLFAAKAAGVIQVGGAYGMVLVAFAGGFSERLVLRVVRSIVERREN